MLMAGFKPAIPTSMRSQTNEVDDTANGFKFLYSLPFQHACLFQPRSVFLWPFCLAHRPLPAARCPLPAARCPLPAVRCPLSAARCPLPAVPTSPAIQLSDFILCHATATISHYLNTSPSSDDDDDTFVEGFSFTHERYKDLTTFTSGIFIFAS